MKIKLELDAQQMQALHEALMLLSYGRAAPVINEINRQIQTSLDDRVDGPAPVVDDSTASR